MTDIVRVAIGVTLILFFLSRAAFYALASSKYSKFSEVHAWHAVLYLMITFLFLTFWQLS